MRSRSVVLLVSLLALAACKKVDPAEQRKLLESEDPKKREQAAEELKKLFAKDPKSAGDLGPERWAEKVKNLPSATDTERAELMKHPTPSNSITTYRLDDFWVFSVTRDSNQSIQSAGPPAHSLEFVDVKVPDGFSGTWTTYYVNGMPHESDDYDHGKLRHTREMFESGLSRREANMVEGKTPGTFVPNGVVITKFEDGKPAIEDNFDHGVLNGPRKSFYPSGKLKQEGKQVNGEFDGLLTNYREDGSEEWCILYAKGREVNRGCPLKK